MRDVLAFSRTAIAATRVARDGDTFLPHRDHTRLRMRARMYECACCAMRVGYLLGASPTCVLVHMLRMFGGGGSCL